MKIISKEEYDKILFRYTSRDQNKDVYQLLRQLQINEALIIKKDEWKGKKPATGNILGVFRKSRTPHKFTTKTLEDKSGWAVLRIL